MGHQYRCAEKLAVPGTDPVEHLPCPEPADPDGLYCKFHRPAYTTRSTR